MMINKPMLTKGVTCSKDKSDDLFRAEEPNDEFYHGNTIEDQMNLDKTEIRQIIMKKLKLKSMLNNWKWNCRWHCCRKWLWEYCHEE